MILSNMARIRFQIILYMKSTIALTRVTKQYNSIDWLGYCYKPTIFRMVLVPSKYHNVAKFNNFHVVGLPHD